MPVYKNAYLEKKFNLSTVPVHVMERDLLRMMFLLLEKPAIGMGLIMKRGQLCPRLVMNEVC